jgi:hypothetical protein
VQRLPAAHGGTVDVHPLAWSPLAAVPAIAEFCVAHRPDAIRMDVVMRRGALVADAERVVRELPDA